MEMKTDRISETFNGERIFLTGGTGFMGKVFIERLLRLTNVDKIYLLVREKRNKKPSERVEEIFQNPLFNDLKSQSPSSISKIHLIEGDCSALNLKISEADQLILAQNVSMIFHFAATVRFSEKFKRAIELNVRGTREMLSLSKRCTNLKLFCHISTAYCHLDEKILLEQFYPFAVDPNDALKIIEQLDEAQIEKIFSKHLSKNIPNSYVFTKALAEALIVESQVPVLICRPAIVAQTYAAPILGWTDNLNNMTGLIYAGCMGIMRNLNCSGENGLNVVPVDYAISNVMAASWNYLKEPEESRGTKFVNLFYSSIKCSTFNEDIGNLHPDFHFDRVLWIPNVSCVYTKWIYDLRTFLFQWIPAYVIDRILNLINEKSFLVNAQTKLSKELAVLHTFINNDWIFDTSNLLKIHGQMSEVELKNYGTIEFDERKFLNNCLLGIRRYMLKEKDEDLPKARKKAQLFYMADNLIKMMFFGYIFYLVMWFFRKIYN